MKVVSRFEVIDPTGRVIVMYASGIQFELQDNNQTLKVFVPRIINKGE